MSAGDCVVDSSVPFVTTAFPVALTQRRREPNLLRVLGFAGLVAGQCAVGASPIAAQQSVVITPAPPVLVVGETFRLNATIKDAARREPPQDQRTWVSSDTTVAKVTSVGLVTAIAPGEATLTVAIGKLAGSTSVHVLDSLVVGGSNYVMYSVGSYVANPTQKAWFEPGNMRPVIGTYHLDSMAVRRQLERMYANGQRSIALLLWYGDFSSDARISDSLVYGHVVNSKLGHLMPRHVANLQRVLDLIRQIGYRRIVFRFDGQAVSRSREWKHWDEVRYQQNWRFLISTRAIVDSSLKNSGISLVYDLDAEGAGVDVGQQRAYVVRL